MDDNAADDLRRAVGAIAAMTEGDPNGFVVPYREARDEDNAAGGDRVCRGIG